MINYLFTIVSHVLKGLWGGVSNERQADRVYIFLLPGLGIGDQLMLAPLATHLKRNSSDDHILLVTAGQGFIESLLDDPKITEISFKDFVVSMFKTRTTVKGVFPSFSLLNYVVSIFCYDVSGYCYGWQTTIGQFTFPSKPLDPVYGHYQDRLKAFGIKEVTEPVSSRTALKKAVLPTRRPFILIAPYGLKEERFWPSWQWVFLLNSLYEKLELKPEFILLGSSAPAELHFLHQIENNVTAVRNMAGRFSFPELAMLAEKSSYFLGLDNGLSHLSYNFGHAGCIFYTNVLPASRKPSFLKDEAFISFYGGQSCDLAPCQNTTMQSRCMQVADKRFICCTVLSEPQINKLATHMNKFIKN